MAVSWRRSAVHRASIFPRRPRLRPAWISTQRAEGGSRRSGARSVLARTAPGRKTLGQEIRKPAREIEMTEVKLKAEGTQLLGIGIAGQPLALGFGNVAGADYVNVVTNSGNPYQWQVVSLASDGRTTKLHIGKPD